MPIQNQFYVALLLFGSKPRKYLQFSFVRCLIIVSVQFVLKSTLLDFSFNCNVISASFGLTEMTHVLSILLNSNCLKTLSRGDADNFSEIVFAVS